MKTDLIAIKAYAKINLLLDVLYKRPDGYHELEGIMQSVSICDDVTVERAEGVIVECDAELP
ncbi:MAG: 4-(cytidine 5'-diphospho)-2-C-methyl-D-erythritol kinase, partial [Clostridia bacterium]|nr:4-(cytidine 5'-diphospho)-2-C-methyl-D-erythritol kinase [Clostridia bacterium]